MGKTLYLAPKASTNRIKQLGLSALCTVALGFSQFGHSSDTAVEAESTPPFTPGLWWSNALNGHGFDIQYADDQIFIVFYTYNDDGSPTWYTAQGKLDGNHLKADLLSHRWDVKEAKHQGFEVQGSIDLDIQNKTSIKFDINILSNGKDNLSTGNLTSFAASSIETEIDHTGLWYNLQNSGYGFSYIEQDRWLTAAYYFYSEQGEPRWVIGNNNGTGINKVSLDSYTGYCLHCEKASPQPKPAADIEFGFSNETSATVNINPTSESTISQHWAFKNTPLGMLSNPSSTRPSRTALMKFTKSEELAARLKEGYIYNTLATLANVDFSPAPTAQSSSSFSTTNLQVQGVDEADNLKGDANCAFAFPTEKTNEIRSLSLNSVGKITSNGSIPIDEYTSLNSTPNASPAFAPATGIRPLGVYLTSDHIAALSTKSIQYFGYVWTQDQVWVEGNSYIDLFDRAADSCAASTANRIELDGYIVSSRRIGNKLYVIWRTVPTPAGVIITSSEQELKKQLEDVALEELLPRIRVGNGDWQPAVTEDKVLFPQSQQDPSSNFVVISEIDLNKPDEINGTAVVGQIETLYVSPTSIYIATSERGYVRAINSATYSSDTRVHQFSLTDGIKYFASGNTSGYLNSDIERSGFRFSQIEDDLALVTTVPYKNSNFHQLSIMTPSKIKDGLLVQRSVIPNKKRIESIGKPNENLHATRFVGERLYAVTFERTDPLYVIDLADRDDPYVAGAVELPGFSDYLHPLPNNKLLGLGYKVVNGGINTGTILTGLQLNLFDVSDPKNPSVLQQLDIARRGSSTAALSSHHGFSFLPANGGNPARVSIPLNRHDVAAGESPSTSPLATYPWQDSGLYHYKLNNENSAISKDGALITVRRGGSTNVPKEAYDASSGRSILYGENVIYYEGGRVWGGSRNVESPEVGPL